MEQVMNVVYAILPYIFVFLGIALCSTLLAVAVYVWTFLHKKIDLKHVDYIKEENRQVLEEANFLKTSTKYGQIVEDQIKEVKMLKNEVKILRAQKDDLETEITAQSKK